MLAPVGSHFFLYLLILFSSISNAADLDFVDADLSTVIRTISDLTKTDIVIDPRVKDRVTLKAYNYPGHQLLDFLSKILEAHNYLMVSDGGVMRVIPKNHIDKTSLINSDVVVIYRKLYGVDPSAFSQLLDNFALRTIVDTDNNALFVVLKKSDIDTIESLFLPHKKPIDFNEFNYTFRNQVISNISNDLKSFFEYRGIKYSISKVTNSVFYFASRGLDFSALDRKSKQVRLTAYVFETSKSNAVDTGLTITTKFGASLPSRSQDSFFVDLTKVLDFPFLYDYLTTNNRTSIVSSPSLLVLDGHKASFLIGNELPVLTSVNNDSGDDDSDSSTVDRIDVGVKLSVGVDILGDSAFIDLTQELSSITDSTSAVDVITNKRELTTTISLNHGESVVLGGLSSNSSSNTYSGLPFLNSMPILKDIFGRKSNSKSKSEFLLVLHCEIL